MPRRKTSIIWQIDKDDLQRIIDESDTIVSVLIKLGLDPYNGNHKTFNSRVKEENLSLEQLSKNRKVLQKQHLSNLHSQKISNDSLFCENSSSATMNVKKRILKDKLIEYKCIECCIIDVYNNKPIVLQLDHKNGINNDHRLENLRFLCANCHSQTTNFSGKKNKKRICYESIENKQKRIEATRKFNPKKEHLAALVEKLPMTKIGIMYGVSDTAVRKRCKLLGINF